MHMIKRINRRLLRAAAKQEKNKGIAKVNESEMVPGDLFFSTIGIGPGSQAKVDNCKRPVLQTYAASAYSGQYYNGEIPPKSAFIFVGDYAYMASTPRGPVRSLASVFLYPVHGYYLLIPTAWLTPAWQTSVESSIDINDVEEK